MTHLARCCSLLLFPLLALAQAPTGVYVGEGGFFVRVDAHGDRLRAEVHRGDKLLARLEGEAGADALEARDGSPLRMQLGDAPLLQRGDEQVPLERRELVLEGCHAAPGATLRLGKAGDRLEGQLTLLGQPPLALAGQPAGSGCVFAAKGAEVSVRWRPDGLELRYGRRRQRLERVDVPGFRFLRFETFRYPNDIEGELRFSVAIYRFERYAKAIGLEPDQSALDVEFVRLPPDGRAVTAEIGSRATEKGREMDERPMKVTIRPMLVARTETSQRVWFKLGGEAKPSRPGDLLPIEQVSWDAVDAWVTAQGLRLPRDGEAEYIIRSGSTLKSPFPTGSRISLKLVNIDMRALYSEGDVFQEGKLRTFPGGTYPPNAYGLYDTIGNAWEWCADKSPDNPVFRVRRGGAFETQPRGARSANRSAGAPFGFGQSLSFRAFFTIPKR